MCISENNNCKYDKVEYCKKYCNACNEPAPRTAGIVWNEEMGMWVPRRRRPCHSNCDCKENCCNCDNCCKKDSCDCIRKCN